MFQVRTSFGGADRHMPGMQGRNGEGEMSERKEELLKQLEELLDYLYSHHVNKYEIQITDAVQEMPVISVSFDQDGC